MLAKDGSDAERILAIEFVSVFCPADGPVFGFDFHPPFIFLLVACVSVRRFTLLDRYLGALRQGWGQGPSPIRGHMDGLAGINIFSDRRLSDSEGGTAEASTLRNGLASTRNGRTRKTRGSDIGWLYCFGIRTKVLLRLVGIASAQTSTPLHFERNSFEGRKRKYRFF